MSTDPDPRPTLAPASAASLAREAFAVEGEARSLPGDRDRSFRLDGSDGRRFVLKLASVTEERDSLELQVAALTHLAEAEPALAVPRVVTTPAGEALVEIEDDDGDPAVARMLTWLPGRKLADCRPHGPPLLESLGAFLARLDQSLSSFGHPAARRSLQWAMDEAPETVERHLDAVDRPGGRALLQRFLDLYGSSDEDRGRRSIVHNDANDHNVLVGDFEAGRRGELARRVSGLIDFGDLMESWVVAELAVACAYALLNKPDPLGAAARVAAGYSRVTELSDAECAALFPMICMRLSVSVAISAHRVRSGRDDVYARVSETPAWEALERLSRINPRLAFHRIRAATTDRPNPATRRVEDETARLSTHPVLGVDLSEEPTLTLDLSVGSPELGSDAQAWDTARFAREIFGRMDEAGARVAVGRYDEARRWYGGDAYQEPGNDFPERRTVHLGIDLFAPAGTPVHAPLEGTVHSFRDNSGHLDYGPTVILEHRLPGGASASAAAGGRGGHGGAVFHTLYGHLSRDSLEGLEAGQTIAKGERFAFLGNFPENGGWPPHLHFQVVVDLLGEEGDFPGVAAPSQRDLWLSISPDPAPLLGLPETARAPRSVATEKLLAQRDRLLAPSLSVAYRKPLHTVRGTGQYLLDAEGRTYLDAVNNVPHVGHSHPKVVEAARRQLGVLNTNTRYLHETVLRYARRLGDLFPDPLGVCFFVNSGSEANELALRLAQTHTSRTGVVVVEGGYHGNTSATVALSHYKFAGPGGKGPPEWVRVAPLPDPYRGLHPDPGPAGGRRYAEAVGAAAVDLAASEHSLAAFLVEPLIGCGGQVVPPDDYLPEAFRLAREHGAVCLADEVQVGFGRVGSHMWGFEALGATPDIVTLGKPMGNGHPLGAVVTTPEIAASFDTGMEYFNTFGGNPVSCAVGMAVLDVLEEEGLLENALRVGGHLKGRLGELMERHPAVGHVRGMGLYIGVELVRDRNTREPAGDVAGYVAERMRDRGILVSTDGPDHNVLKIKPPMCFNEENADRLADTLDDVLGEDFVRDRCREA